jgi:hypothetical protein
MLLLSEIFLLSCLLRFLLVKKITKEAYTSNPFITNLNVTIYFIIDTASY